ncbi:act minimal PKS chain-length factor (CLF/KS beta) [Nocardia tenerifensis]|uniref:Act minimal PKS chain-length factor (CLF/KS beta) n=1 Tax=Nocardia tenerifensis TaxID=228006 RepID=A0A318L0S6_9NOCA|nr:ketosynthase chain-length factor [Nocardia tenerifensis]PXX71714.1 act minimal PKS chain-length factor (CLF/KS beta) [Nocardia tenerifensis]
MTTVFTGVGVIAPNGLDVESFWAACCGGDSAIGRLTAFDTDRYPARCAGEINDFDAEGAVPARLLPQTDRMTRFALVAAEAALADAAYDPSVADRDRVGVVTAATSGGYEFGQRELQNLWSQGSDHVSAFQSFAWFYAVNTGQIAIRHDLRGPTGVVVSDHAGGLDALAQSRRQLRRGAELALSGGTDSSLCPWGWAAHLADDRLSRADDPDRAYRPFDADASGYVPGEGGAMLVLEDAAAARRRAVPRVYGRLAGYAATFDPRPGSDRPPGLATAMRLALADAELEPADIDVVFADGAASPDADRHEAAALCDVFGPYGVPVTVPKTMTGRLGSGGGPLDVVAALLSIRDAVIPPTVRSVAAPAYRIDLVTSLRRRPVRAALVLARGHGGFNSAVVVAAEQTESPEGQL